MKSVSNFNLYSTNTRLFNNIVHYSKTKLSFKSMKFIINDNFSLLAFRRPLLVGHFGILTATLISIMPMLLQAQISNKQVRLSITDEIGTKISRLDTLLPAEADIDAVLLKMGYDAESVAKAYIGNNARRITVKTEEIVPQNMHIISSALPQNGNSQTFRQKSTDPIIETHRTTTTDNTPKDSEFDLNEILENLPPNAIIEELPDGKKITTVTTNAKGETETKELIIKTTRQTTTRNGSPIPQWNADRNPKNNRQPIVIDGPISTETLTNNESSFAAPSHNNMQPQKNNAGAIAQSESRNIVSSTNDHNTTTAYTSQNFGKYANANQLPKLQVAVADLDMFDNSTLNSRNPAALNYGPLTISEFLVKPDFQQGYYQFSFNLPPDKNSEYSTKIEIYDAVGYLVYTESFTESSYKKYLPEFHLYKKGTFLVLITHDSKKYSQKITFE